MKLTIPDWVTKSIFYQIFPERFCNGDPANDPRPVSPWGASPERENFFGGDLKGILERLPYLADLGVNALYLTPIFEARTNHKYDAVDYLKIDSAFGDLALFKELVHTAHQGGMRIVLDAVFNHCGNGFWAFQDLLDKGPDSIYRDWFFPSDFPVQQFPVNYQTCGGTHYLPKLNTANPEVRAHLLHVARYWLEETGIDGWRLDVPWKTEMDFWYEFRKVVKTANPQAYIVAETWRDPAPWVNSGSSDAVMNYPLRDYILDYCVYDHMDAEDFYYFTRRLLEGYAEAAPYQLNLLGSHDTPRLLTLCKEDRRRMALAVTAAFTLPGVPMIYYGDEIGMTGENDPDCRRCMPWDESGWDHDLQTLYKKLIHVRREHPALQTGRLEPLLIFNGVLVFRRKLEEDEVLVILNPRDKRSILEIPLAQNWNGKIILQDILSGKLFRPQAGRLVLDLLPEKSALVLIPVSEYKAEGE